MLASPKEDKLSLVFPVVIIVSLFLKNPTKITMTTTIDKAVALKTAGA